MGWWFGDSQDVDEEYGDEHAGAAARLCREGCPIQRECLIQALTFHETSGVWGGMTTAQRESIKGRI